MLKPKILDRLSQPLTLILTIGLMLVAAAFGPLEKTLGIQVRIVYFHGAWVWAGLTVFGASALCGLAGLITRRRPLHLHSRSLGLTGLIFWLTYLPISLLVMQLNWGGLFFDEPRWKVPFAFAIVALLLQAGLFLMNMDWAVSAANTLFAAALFWSLDRAVNILHPDSPIFQSNSVNIQVFFVLLFLFALLAGWQINILIHRKLASSAGGQP